MATSVTRTNRRLTRGAPTCRLSSPAGANPWRGQRAGGCDLSAAESNHASGRKLQASLDEPYARLEEFEERARSD